jgi:hypothetical protein
MWTLFSSHLLHPDGLVDEKQLIVWIKEARAFGRPNHQSLEVLDRHVE